jgi:hypothetical protein
MGFSGQLHAPVRFIPAERDPGTHLIGGWVGPTAGLDAVVKRKKCLPCPCKESNPGEKKRQLSKINAEEMCPDIALIFTHATLIKRQSSIGQNCRDNFLN